MVLDDASLSACATIDRILKDAVQSNRFLGISYVVVNNRGETPYSAAHGFKNFSKTEPMLTSTPGWLASMTKIMTCVAAMQVVERGLIGLDDDLGLIVPELGNRQVLCAFNQTTGVATWRDPTEKITLRRLLSHSSGFAYDAWEATLQSWSVANGKHQEFATGEWKAYDRPLVFDPGASWIYGPGIDWAGKVVETLTHQSLEEYMQTNIWGLLSMNNTTFHPERRKTFAKLDMGFRPEDANGPLSPGQSPWPIPVTNELGGAGGYSSAEDYARLLAALLTDDPILLKQKTIQELMKPQLSDAARAGLSKARGLGLVQVDIPVEIKVDHALGGLFVLDDIPSRRRKGSVCWDGMSNPQWMIDRSSGLACVLMTQILPCPDPATKALWGDLEEVVYAGFDRS